MKLLKPLLLSIACIPVVFSVVTFGLAAVAAIWMVLNMFGVIMLLRKEKEQTVH